MAEHKYIATPSRTPPAAKKTWKYVRSNILTVLTIIGIVFGIAFGTILKNHKEDKWSQREQAYVKFGGEIFLRMLKALTLPLILSSVIAALGSLDLRLSGKVGLRTFLYYLLTTFFAVFLGIILVITIHPGIHNDDEKLQHYPQFKPRKILNTDVMMDMIRNMFPSNLVRATLSQYQTILDMPSLEKLQRREGQNETIDDSDIPTKPVYVDGTNMLGLLVFSTAFGLALSSVGTYGKPLLKLFRCLSQIMIVLAGWILWLAPVGIFCLLAGRVLETNNMEENLSKTGLYIFTVLLGLSLHGLIVLPVLYFVITGSHPFKLIGNVVQALVTAFGTSSSTAALPATISCVEEKHGVDPRVARFVLPIGAAVNMDGTALYEAVAAIFLVQLHGIAMDFSSIVAVSFIATIATIGGSGIPQSGLVTMSMLLNVLGLPLESIAILIPADVFLHRFRTAVNVLGDALGASLVDKLCRDELDDLDKLPVERICSNQILGTSVEDI